MDSLHFEEAEGDGCHIDIPIDQLPTVHNPMKKVVKGLRKNRGYNFPSSLFVLGETQSNSFQGRDTHVTMYTDVYMVALVCVDIHAGA